MSNLVFEVYELKEITIEVIQTTATCEIIQTKADVQEVK